MRTRLLTVAVVATMALGSLALWVAIPAAWLWLTRDLQPAATRFLITIAGCIITMVSAGYLLYRLEAFYDRIRGSADREPAEPAWMRSSREAGASRPRMSLLEILLTASALAALVALVVWWVFFADSPNPSGPLQPL